MTRAAAALWLAALALVPRLAFVFKHAGNDVSESLVLMGNAWLSPGNYLSQIPVRSPLYVFSVTMLERCTSWTGLPAYYFSNLLSVAFVFITLWYLYLISLRYLSPWRAFGVAAAFNFFPHELVMGAATTETNFMLAFGAMAFYAFVSGRTGLAIFFGYLSTISRIQGIALLVSLFGVCLLRDWRARDTKSAARHFVLGVVTAVLIFLPTLLSLTEGFGDYSPYHKGEFTLVQEIGAFVLRFLNMLGPVGVVLALGVLIIRRKELIQPLSDTKVLALMTVAISLAIVTRAPWEAFYFLPVAPFLYFLMFKASVSRLVLAIFLASSILPNFIQLQFKPWKMPPYAVRGGVLEAHLKRDWLIRSGP